ncbi:MAG: hypothetical protein C5B51_08065 [Terriglobia bacterium]|nr:MAG: hypothetical protein C5B51_08065 [Terriglobia bacterium]
MGKAASGYRIVLTVTEADCPQAVLSLRSLFQNSAACEPIVLLGPRAVTNRVSQLGAGTRVRFVHSGASSHDDLFSEALRLFALEDVIVIRPGIVVPMHWDARLAAAAGRRNNIATVSPLHGGHLDIGMPRELSDIPAESGAWVDRVDSHCYEISMFEQPRVPSFFRGCAYVRREAIRSSQATQPDAFKEAALRLRYEHVVADHVFVGNLPGQSLTDGAISRAADPVLLRLRASVRAKLESGTAPAGNLGRAGRSSKLHVLHSWGGGLEHWVREYCWADRQHRNLVLKSYGPDGHFGSELRLYRAVDDPQPVAVWDLSPSYPNTAIHHAAYQSALYQIIEEYSIDSLVISSLIGHSLDVLETGLPAVFVCHDFYPFCPAFNITHNGICTSCTREELTACTLENPHNRFFSNTPPESWLGLRAAFTRICGEQSFPMVAPSESVRRHYIQLIPSLQDKFTVIPHGTRPIREEPLDLDPLHEGKLRVLVLGSLAPQKGLSLFQAIAGDLLQRAEIHLIGCGPWCGNYQGVAGITVMPEYVREELPGLLEKIRPDLALLLSIVPETFSYTLHELLELAIPVLATDIGSFRDRIEDSRSGFLCAPSPEAVLQRIRELDSRRQQLLAVHRHLRESRTSTLGQMLSGYDALLQTPEWSPGAYFQRDRTYASPRDRIQVFWRPTGGAFQERDSHSISCRLGEKPQLVHFPIPPLPYVPGQLRLDFANRPGLRLLKNTRLMDRSGTVLWQLGGGEAQFETQNDVQVLKALADGSLVMVATSEDPFITLPVNRQALAALQGGGALEVEIAAPPPEEYLPILVRSLSEDHSAEIGDRDRLIRVLSHTLATSQTRERTERQRLEHEMARVRADFARQRADSAAIQGDLREQLAQMYDSYSWRVSKPLRAVASLLLRLKPSLMPHHSSNGRKPAP